MATTTTSSSSSSSSSSKWVGSTMAALVLSLDWPCPFPIHSSQCTLPHGASMLGGSKLCSTK